MRLSVALLSCTLLAACATGNFGGAHASRALVPGRSSHAVFVYVEGVGDLPVWAPRARSSEIYPPVSVGYRFGLTDQLSLLFPLAAEYAWRPTGALQLGFAGGAASLAVGDAWLEPFHDPRRPNAKRNTLFVGWTATAVAKWTLRHNLAALGTLSATQWSAGDRLDDRRAVVTFAAVFSPSEQVTFALPLGASWEHSWYGRQSSQVLQLGGSGSDGYAPVPMLTMHLAPGFDLFVSPGAAWSLGARRWQLSASFGWQACWGGS